MVEVADSGLPAIGLHSNKVALEILNKEIIIKSINEKPRSGWMDAFEKMHENEEDGALISENIDSGNSEWVW